MRTKTAVKWLPFWKSKSIPSETNLDRESLAWGLEAIFTLLTFILAAVEGCQFHSDPEVMGGESIWPQRVASFTFAMQVKNTVVNQSHRLVRLGLSGYADRNGRCSVAIVGRTNNTVAALLRIDMLTPLAAKLSCCLGVKDGN